MSILTTNPNTVLAMGHITPAAGHNSRDYEEPFLPYPKTPRLNREVVISEKLDGTNARIVISLTSEATGLHGSMLPPEYFCSEGDFVFRAGSRSKWITPGKQTDNYGFAQWVLANKTELLKLGPGRHFGEWWGQGIQRNYGLNEKRFSLFDAGRWNGNQFPGVWEQIDGTTVFGPACCHVVPVLFRGMFDTRAVQSWVEMLAVEGSAAVPGWMRPEGVVVYHTAAKQAFKVSLENDDPIV